MPRFLLIQCAIIICSSIGYWLVIGHFDFGPLYGYILAVSSCIWQGYSLLIPHSYIGLWPFAWLYFGLLSPFLGCLLVMPPYSLLLFYDQPLTFLTCGMVTAFIVHHLSVSEFRLMYALRGA